MPIMPPQSWTTRVMVSRTSEVFEQGFQIRDAAGEGVGIAVDRGLSDRPQPM